MSMAHDVYKKDEVNWNIIEERDFKQITQDVFHNIATVLSRTIGPYGATTFLEQTGEYHVTKDGWNIIKHIHFNKRTHESIVELIRGIAGNVVRNVGDGSTTSIVSAHTLLKYLEATGIDMRPKDTIDTLKSLVKKISDEIYAQSTKVRDFGDIHRLAMISTNGDTHVSNIIREIYEETGNPSIDFNKSFATETSYEVVIGYKSDISYIDSVYATEEDGSAVIYNPKVLMFDHKVSTSTHLEFIEELIHEARRDRRPIVIIAPHYNKRMLETIQSIVMSDINTGNGDRHIIAARASLINNDQHHMYGDLAALVGAKIVRESDMEKFNEVEPVVVNGEAKYVRVESDIDAKNYIGSVGKMLMNAKETVFSDFNNIDERMLEIQKRDANAKLNEMIEKSKQYETFDIQLYRAKLRTSRLLCKMGIIQVGGESALERTVNYDAIEDAVKACESAYHHGYNLGGSFAIALAIDEVFRKNDVSYNEATLLGLMKTAFLEVFSYVLHNEDPSVEISHESTRPYYEKVKETGNCYNILTGDYDEDVINPTDTDVEILAATVSIVSLLISSNQYVATMPEFKFD